MLDNIIICRLYRTIWRPKKATKSATFEIPNWFHKSLKNQRHICSTFIRKFVNDVWSSKQWTSDSLEQRLFLRPFWPYSLHTFSLVSLVKKYATCKAKMAFQKAFVHGNLTFIVFLIPSLTFFIMNVEKIQSILACFQNCIFNNHRPRNVNFFLWIMLKILTKLVLIFQKLYDSNISLINWWMWDIQLCLLELLVVEKQF